MSKVKLDLPIGEFSVTGKQITFAAPCDCSNVECIQIEGVDYCVVDALGRQVTGKTGGGIWTAGAQISVVLDCENKRAFVQNGNATPDQIGAVPTVTVDYTKETKYADDLDVPLSLIRISDTVNAELWEAFEKTEGYAYVRTMYFYKATKTQSHVQIAYSYTNAPTRMAIRTYNANTLTWTPWRTMASDTMTSPLKLLKTISDVQYISHEKIDTALDEPVRVMDFYKDGVWASRFALGETDMKFWSKSNNGYYSILHTGNLTNLGVSKVVAGSYVGTGTFGADNPNTITCGFKPKCIFVVGQTHEYVTSFMCNGATVASSGVAGYEIDLTWSENGVSWYRAGSVNVSGKDARAIAQQNVSGVTYHWVAFG